MSKDTFQTKINQLSLVMTIPEDIVKACKAADLPPQFAEVMIRLHNQQVELEKAINVLRTTQLDMAKLLDMQADYATSFTKTIHGMAQHIGYAEDEVVKSEEIGQG